MRTLLPTFAFVLLAAPAVAGSVEPVAASGAGGSIEAVSCADCPALKPRRATGVYHVEAIAPGTQKIEIREDGGVRKIFRTEAWMGGSPVLFVSKAPTETLQAADAEPPADDAAVAVDASAKTSALAATSAVASSREFDPAGFDLRLD